MGSWSQAVLRPRPCLHSLIIQSSDEVIQQNKKLNYIQNCSIIHWWSSREELFEKALPRVLVT